MPRSASSGRSSQVTSRTPGTLLGDRERGDTGVAVERAAVAVYDRAAEAAARVAALGRGQLVVADGGGGGDAGAEAERAGDEQGRDEGRASVGLEHLRLVRTGFEGPGGECCLPDSNLLFARSGPLDHQPRKITLKDEPA